ncbi:MAG: hypothetical protein JO312_10670, partial [Hyphomicrobiales bacterium]|nr:hypothetical protein [Hyphomicrobiales bacterium]
MRSTMILATAALGGLLAVSPDARADGVGYTFSEIYPPGAAPGTLVGYSNYGLNNIGQVVGGYQDNAGNVHGYIYSGGKYVTFDAPGSIAGTSLNGINDFGQTVGTAAFGSTGQGETFLYSQGKLTKIA